MERGRILWSIERDRGIMVQEFDLMMVDSKESSRWFLHSRSILGIEREESLVSECPI